MQKLRKFCLDLQIPTVWNAPMSDYTTFRIGGYADALVFPDSEEELLRLLIFLKAEELPFRVLGNASNLLVSDGGFRGVLVTSRHIRSVSRVGSTVRAACGTPINVLCRTMADASLDGLADLYGIPATVGGAVFMNAGAFGTSIGKTVDFVTAFNVENGKTETISKKDCEFAYRKSVFSRRRELIVLSATFKAVKGETEKIREKMKDALRVRSEKHPVALPSAGSVFKKHEGQGAGALIESAGLKGLRVGGAAVSDKHAGFIVNLGGATAKDVLSLIAIIKERVYEKHGVLLNTEIEYVEN